MNQLTAYSNEFDSLGVCFFIVTLMKEIKPVVTERHHFDSRDETIFKTIFWKNWTIRILIQGSVSMVF